MSDGPFWLAPLGLSATGVDHLGLRAPGLAMADALLPGITNTTKRVRYYTIIAWMYHHAKTRGHLQLLESAFVQSIRKHKHVTTGGVSAIGSQTLPTAEKNGRVPLLMSSGHLPSVLEPANYGPSAYVLGIAGDDDGQPRVTREARDLARTLGIDDARLPTVSDTSIAVSALDDLGPLCFCQGPVPGERRLLEDFLFRMQSRRREAELATDGPRRRTLALVLHLLPAEDEPLSILQRVLDWALSRDGYAPPPELEEEAYGMALLTTRWHLRHSLEAVWSAFGRLIAEHAFRGCSATPYVDAVLAKASGEDEWTPSRDATLGAVRLAADAAPGAEHRGSQLVLERLDEDPALALLHAAVLLALLAARVPKLTQPKRYYQRFLDLGDPYWVPISAFAKRVDDSMTLREWLTHLIERYAIAQHFLTGARKPSHVEGFFFHPTEVGYRLSPSTRRWGPDGGPTKVPSSLSLLEGLQLVEETETGWERTTSGTEMLDAVLKDPGVR